MTFVPPPPATRVIAKLEPDADGDLWYILQTDGAPPEHPHSPRFYGQVFGGMGTCHKPGPLRKHCKLTDDTCEYGCVRDNELTRRTKVYAETMATALTALEFPEAKE